MKAKALVVAAAWWMLGGPCAAFTQESIPALPLISANRYGANGDGKAVDTKAIQAAIDAAARMGEPSFFLRAPTCPGQSS